METADLLAPQFTDEDSARTFLESKRWPNGPVCPHCNFKGQSYRIEPKPGSKTRKGLLKCGACREQFSVTVGTIMEDSHIPLNKWLLAFHLLCASKKGMSAHQLHRMLGVTYKSAWFMAHRIRYAMTQEPLSSKLRGVVEVDEAYIGGKQRGVRGLNPEGSNKVPVISMVERSLVTRKGRVRSFPVERVTVENLKPILKEHITAGTTLNTDEAVVYFFCQDEFPNHDVVTHSKQEYVRIQDGRKVTTNTVEGYFGNLKRGLNGVYHHVDKQHLHRYLSEFDFRYNAREVSDVERRNLALAGIEGKRLTYRDSCKKA